MKRNHTPVQVSGAVGRRGSRTRLLVALICAALAQALVATTTSAQPLTSNPLFERDEQLLSTNSLEHARFGLSAALSGDGSTALLGGPGEESSVGAAWVFGAPGLPLTQQITRFTGAEQGEQASETACGEEASEGSGECYFGRSVALSEDGNTALVGAPLANGGKGAVWVFTRSGSGWTQQGIGLAADPEQLKPSHFGRSVALSADGATALVGAPLAGGGEGAVWVFTRSGAGWSAGEELSAGAEQTGPGRLGRSVALSADGNTALVGAPAEESGVGAVWTLARSAAGWAFVQSLRAGSQETGAGRFGAAVALSGDGRTTLIGVPGDRGDSGAALSYEGASGAFAQPGALITGGEVAGAAEFGASLALSYGASNALIGGPHDNGRQGAVWTFTREGSSWTQQGAKLQDEGHVLKDPRFGSSVALSANGSDALVGEPGVNGGTAWALAGPAPAAPAVSTVTPSSGPAAGASTVTITGSGFLPGATVQIGALLTAVNVVSETEITAQTAATPAGSYEVVVTDANGVSSHGPSYTYTSSTTGNEGGSEPQSQSQSPQSGSGSSSSFGPSPTSGATGSGSAHGEVLASHAALPVPQLGISGNLAPVSGTVLVRVPGSLGFVRLAESRQVPFGTIIDATHGRVTVTTVGKDGKLQAMTFYAGVFMLTQGHEGLVVAALVGGSFSACPTAKERAHRASSAVAHAATASKHVVRKLWASGHGSYSTRGSYASGAVEGTTWLTEDLCDGTLIKVATDRVLVTNLVKHTHRIVRAPHSYLAHAPR
jgi:IPT/TIG domain/FG-GAP repeat